MLHPFEGNIVARARNRDFFAAAWALAVCSHGDVDFANSQIADANAAHARNMADLAIRYGDGSAPAYLKRRMVSEHALAPIKILEAFAGEGGQVHLRHDIPGSDLIGTFPAEPVVG